METEMIPVGEVAKELHWQHRQVIVAMMNGTLPIGAVIPPQKAGGKDSARIPRERWERWKKGEM